ncbi:Serine O-succinyltransferase [Balamuthia mandrillaris]
MLRRGGGGALAGWRGASLQGVGSFLLPSTRRSVANNGSSSLNFLLSQRRNVYKQSIFAMSSGRRNVHLKQPFPLQLGGALPELDITWEEWGNADNPNVVVIFPSLSVGSHAKSSVEDPTAGWWEGMIGPDKGIDTDKFRVICASGLGSPYGTTSPVSINPNTGEAYGKHFPQVTPTDLARCHKLLLEHLGLKKIHAAVGASLGGCKALSFAAEFPDFVDNVCVINCTGKSSPGSVAYRHVQRQAVIRDPDYCHGDYALHKKKPVNGMAVARQLGMITYRTWEELNQRFSWEAEGPFSIGSDQNFAVERYLKHKANDFVNSYDANCYLLLSKATDLMDLGRGFNTYSEGVLRITANLMMLAVETDALIPVSEQQHIVQLLQAHGKPAAIRTLKSIYGHDAFFLDFAWFIPQVREFLEEGLAKKPHHHRKRFHK